MKVTLVITIGLCTAFLPLATASATHTAQLTQSDFDTWYLDIFVNTTPGDDWNASQFTAQTTGAGLNNAKIRSPLDNELGAWTPPFPYSSSIIDTYLISPSNTPTQFPTLALSSYNNGDSASAAWLDPVATTAPSSFLAARIAIDLTREPAFLFLGPPAGFLFMTVSFDSATQLGAGSLFHTDINVYGVPEPGAGVLAVALLVLASHRRIRHC